MDELGIKILINQLCERAGVDNNSAREAWSFEQRELADFLRDLRSGKLKVVAA